VVGNKPIDIVIPTALDLYNLTNDLVVSLEKYTTSYHVIHIHNGCKNPIEYENATNIFLSRNYGFARGMNIGMSQRQEDNDVIILNNDTEVTRGWLEALTETRDKHPNSIISPMYSFNCIKEIVRKEDDIPGEDFQIKKTPAICWYIPNSVIQKVGMLDVNYDYGWQEDMDYCMKMEKAGLEMWISAKSFLKHKGTVTSRFMDQTKAYDYDFRAKNMAYFYQKWASR
jgi:GT2 family glycosyltransferase